MKLIMVVELEFDGNKAEALEAVKRRVGAMPVISPKIRKATILSLARDRRGDA